MSIFEEAPQPWVDMSAPDLVSLLKVDDDLFVSRFNQCNINGRLFGGQALGQSVAAAMTSVTGKAIHSMHGYFLRPGDCERRVVFRVERTRDGRRFSTRRVTAQQGGKPIFEMSCSFFNEQPGYFHQAAMPPAPAPETLLSLPDLAVHQGHPLAEEIATLCALYPIEIRPAEPDTVLSPGNPAQLRFWVRVAKAAETSDLDVHQQILAYLSDFWLISTALAPHRVPVPSNTLQVASLDHSIWFHRQARVDEWLFTSTDSPSALHGVNLARGLIFQRDGTLIASIAQQGLQTFI